MTIREMAGQLNFLKSKVRDLQRAQDNLKDQIQAEKARHFAETGFVYNLPTSADDWEIYDIQGSALCAKRLTTALKSNLKRFEREAAKFGPRDAAVRCMERLYKVLSRESKFGANDTEPVWHARDAICNHGAALGYQMDREWI
jgi:hypothetical protein